MSPKELLYIDDALGHEKFFLTQCQEAAERLQDKDLQQVAQQLCSRHREIFGKFYHLV